MAEPSTMSLVHFSTSFSFSSGMFLVLSTLRRASSWMKTQRCELQSAWARTDPLTPLAGVEHKKKKGEAGYYNKSENSKGQPKGMMQLTVQNTFQWSCIKLKIDSCILVAWVVGTAASVREWLTLNLLFRLSSSSFFSSRYFTWKQNRSIFHFPSRGQIKLTRLKKIETLWQKPAL